MSYTLSTLRGLRKQVLEDAPSKSLKIFLRIPHGPEMDWLKESKFELENRLKQRVSWSIYLIHAMKALNEQLKATALDKPSIVE